MVPENNNAFLQNPLAPIEDDVRHYIRRCLELDKECNEYKEYVKKTEADTEKIILSFVEVLDAFDKAMGKITRQAGSAQKSKLINEFEKVHKRFNKAMEKCGLEPVKAKSGTKADPSFHMVKKEIARKGLADGIILEVVWKGYLWKGKLLRMAGVKTVKNKQGRLE